MFLSASKTAPATSLEILDQEPLLTTAELSLATIYLGYA